MRKTLSNPAVGEPPRPDNRGTGDANPPGPADREPGAQDNRDAVREPGGDRGHSRHRRTLRSLRRRRNAKNA